MNDYDDYNAGDSLNDLGFFVILVAAFTIFVALVLKIAGVW